MEHVTGIGGIFFKSQDPGQLKTWYQQQLGIEPTPDGTPVFFWRERENPDAMLQQLRAAGTTVDQKIEVMEFGRFGWATDHEGNRFELWESAPGQ